MFHTNLVPRLPNEEEKKQLFEWLLAQHADEPNEEDVKITRECMDGICVAVFDGYTTGGPGYAGRIMVAIWNGGPAQFRAFIWNAEGNLVEQDQDKNDGEGEIKEGSRFNPICVCGQRLELAYHPDHHQLFWNCFACFPIYQRADEKQQHELETECATEQ